MRIILKTAAFITAAGMLFSALSASGTYHQVSGAEEYIYTGYDVSEFDSLLNDFEKLFNESGKEDEIRNCYEQIINESDYINLQCSLAQIQYSKEMTAENLKEYNNMTSVGFLCENKMILSFSRGLKSRYGKLVGQLLDEGYRQKNDSEIYGLTNETEEFIEQKNEIYGRYLEASYSPNPDIIECAEIYLEMVKLHNAAVNSDEYNYFDCAYKLYSRDYSPDDIEKMSDSVASMAINGNEKLNKQLESLKAPNLYSVFENNMEIVQQYSYRISDELSVSADEILEKGLYITGAGIGSEKKAYTTLLSYYNTGIIYQYLYGRIFDLTSAVHEFGHFNSMKQNPIHSVYIHTHNLDIAEVQSQGLEVMYTNFYDSIFGEYAEYMRICQAKTLLGAVASGFLGNEFENYVFDNAQNLTAEDVVEKYRELCSKYDCYNVSFDQVPHFYQYPGYYISYGVSALAALNLWNVMYSDFDRAAQMYTDISHISTYNSGGFSESLLSSGFDDVLSPDFIDHGVSDLISELVSGRIFGDTDGNGTVTTGDLILIVKALLGSEISVSEKSALDMNRDGTVTAADIMIMKKLISQ